MAFANDVVAGFRTIRQITGVVVTVSRGTVTISVVAVPGDSIHQYSQDGQITSELKSRDFLLLRHDYKFNGEETLPQRGDKLSVGGQNYSIMSTAGEAYFRYSDPHQFILRIHCTPV